VTGIRARRARPVGERPRSQHFLRSPAIAAELVGNACVRPGELVLEIGAGDGRLTAELSHAARLVLAVELDPGLAAGLRRRFRGANVEVIEGDALAEPLTHEPFRVVANLPFHATAAILRRLFDDPGIPLTRADVIVEWRAACKRASVWPSTRLGVFWGAWFLFAAERRLPAGCFAPRPSVDAGVLSIRRRDRPLVPIEEAALFRRFVGAGFARTTVREGVRGRISPRALRRLADVYGFPRTAAARELDVHQWTALYAAGRAGASPRRASPE
jgi:23S rRNA (adenine-N6)-dimethyltransferase